MDKIRLAICDDFKEICEYIEFFCQQEEDVDCVATASNGEECIKMVKEHKPDILLLDIQMETDDSGIRILPELLEIHPEMKVIILTAHLEDEYIFSAFAIGVSNYILKSLPFKDMLSIVRDVAQDRTIVRPEIARVLASNGMKMKSSLLYLIDILVKLSPSEFEILRDVYDGLSYAEIASKRFVTVSTVKNHALRILKKTKIHSMKQLISELKNLKIFDLIDHKNDNCR